jgi:hypothetical protein
MMTVSLLPLRYGRISQFVSVGSPPRLRYKSASELMGPLRDTVIDLTPRGTVILKYFQEPTSPEMVML